MGVVLALPDLENWLDAEAESWSALADKDYAALVRQWCEEFLPLVAAGTHSSRGNRAMAAIAARLPADVCLFNGLQVPELMNAGGRGPAGYRVTGLRHVRRELANQLELIVVANDLSWSCVFSHEAGAFAWESFYE
jgi:hypothetical protein